MKGGNKERLRGKGGMKVRSVDRIRKVEGDE